MTNSNFAFLTEHWSFLLKDAQQVESYALRDPRAAAIYARRTLELSLKWLFSNDTALKAPFEKNLAAMIYAPTFSQNIKKGLFEDVRFIHKLGNLAVHGDDHISPQEGLKTTQALHQFLGWLTRVYTRGGAKPEQFHASWLPQVETENEAEQKLAQLSTAQIDQIQDDLKAKDEAATAAEKKLTRTETELAELKKKFESLQQVKATNKKNIGSDEYSESQTRELMIDVMLREAGWNPKAENVEEYEVKNCMPTKSGERTGTGYVDYVLWGKDGKPLGLVEAKRTRSDPEVGKRQAELYADCLEKMHGQRPIIYYSNGYTTWIWDDRFYPPREVHGFATQDELQWKINQRSEQEGLTTKQPSTDFVDRPYHIEASARVMHSFEIKRKRKALIVMATGTGKTRLSVAMVEILMRANWARRVLFLADRIALVNQAKRVFNSLMPHYSVASLLDKGNEDARIVFSTYPTILNCIDGTKKDQKETYSVAHFDLIIIDEAHRSVYQKYGAIFDYFDSLLIGLTATPRGEVDRNTYKLFELGNHQPTFAYELENAVADKFLVPPRAISVPLKFQREGIKYAELSEEEQEEYELQEQFHDEETGELKTEIGSAALNKWLFNEDTITKVLMHLMENGIKVEGGDKLGKTIVFAKNKDHAKYIVKLFDKNYPEFAGKFCQKIDYSVKYAQSLIDDFSIKDKYPQIAVSVDMLDTGIDVPEVVNLVFFKLVRSKTKFWQMLGRGTRLCEDLFAPGVDKKEFIVFDYCQNLEFFDANPEGFDSGIQESVKQKVFKRRLELATVLQNAQPDNQDLVNLSDQLKDQMHTVIESLNLDNFIVRKERKNVETFIKRERWDNLNDSDVKILAENLSGLPSQDDDDEFARRFDLLILSMQLAILQKNKTQESYQKTIIKIADALEDKSAIPTVAAQMELIQDIQTENWWQDITLPMLEETRIKLRDLVRFMDKEDGLDTVYTNFEDEIGEDAKEFDMVKNDPNLTDYYSSVQRFIREHEDHITIRRLKNNQPVSEKDIAALEDILFSEDGAIPREEYEKIYGDKPLGLLVRSIVGLDRQAAKQAFAEFLNESPLLPDQISFLNEIIDYLIKNGVMEPKVMFENPFTNLHDLGVAGIFDNETSKKIIELVKDVNENAEAS